jgi:DNA mismatch endonuclease (patch repair protein)
MGDVHSKATRSYNMSRIRSKDTKPEILVRKYLFANKYRFRLHDKTLPGKPDIILKKHNTLILIHGCFWHGHKNCNYFKVPQTRTKWWLDKINGNIKNDKRNENKLKKAGWKIITIWECEIRPSKRDQTLARLLKRLQKQLK